MAESTISNQSSDDMNRHDTAYNRKDFVLFISATLTTIAVVLAVVFLQSAFKKMLSAKDLEDYRKYTRVEIMEHIRILAEESSLPSLLKLRRESKIPALFINMSMAREGEDGLAEITKEAGQDSDITRIWELAALEYARPGSLASQFQKNSHDPTQWLETLHAAALLESYSTVDFGKEIAGHYICLFPGKKEIDEKIMSDFEGGLNGLYQDPDPDPSGKTKELRAHEFLEQQLQANPAIFKPKSKKSLQETFKTYVTQVFRERDVAQNYKILVREYAQKNAAKLPPEGLELVNRYLSERYFENSINLLERNSVPQDISNSSILSGHSGAVMALAVSPTDGTLASGGFDNLVRLWSPSSPQPRILRGHTLGILTISFSPDGLKLASAGLDGTIRIWDVAKGKQIAQFEAKTTRVGAVAFSPDGKTLAVGGTQGSIRLLDSENGNEIKRFLDSRSEITALLFTTTDGKLIAAGLDKVIRIYDLNNSDPEAKPKTLKKHTAEIWSLALSPDEKLLASASADRTILIWKLANPKSKPKALKKHNGQVLGVSYSSDGKSLISIGTDRTVRRWTLGVIPSLHATYQTDTLINTVRLSRDNAKILLGSDDTAIHVLDASFEGKEDKSLLETLVDFFGSVKG
jgi:WD40 repeat protein